LKTFKVEVGDLFDAGHHILKSVLVKSEKDVSEIRKAFIASAKEMGFFDEKENVFSISNDWRENNIPYATIKILVENKIDLKGVIQDYDLEEIEHFEDLEEDFYEEFEWNSKSKEQAMVRLVMNIAKKSLDFEYEIVKEEKIKSFNDCGSSKFNIGYGLMD
jgi:hypothetical protein